MDTLCLLMPCYHNDFNISFLEVLHCSANSFDGVVPRLIKNLAAKAVSDVLTIQNTAAQIRSLKKSVDIVICSAIVFIVIADNWLELHDALGRIKTLRSGRVGSAYIFRF